MRKKARRTEVVRDADGKPYRPTVLQVIERDEDGTPRVFRLLRDDEEVDLKSTPPSQRAFEVVFAREDLQKRYN